MKKVFKLFGIIALAAIIGFSLVGCSDGGDKDGGTTQPLFSVSGEFKGAGNSNALFKAKTAENRSARAAVSTYELTGELEDGDMVFRLKGTYNSSDGSYIVSSASSFARYTVSGNANIATATLAVKDSNDEWKSFVVSVTIKEVIVKDDNVVDTEGGLPAWARGSWHHQWSDPDHPEDPTWNAAETWSYFDQWYFEAYRSSVWRDNWDFTATKYTVIEANKISDDEYDVIFSYPFYKATRDQKIAALKQFFEEKKHPAELWNYDFAPWDHSIWNEDGVGYYDDSIIWYICMGENGTFHNNGGLKIINWETFIETFKTQEERDEVFGLVDSTEGEWWEKKNALEDFFNEKEVASHYYWGWFEEGWVGEVNGEPFNHEDRAYSCWDPVCKDWEDPKDNWGNWWNTTRYFSKWGNQTSIMGDWDKNREIFQKWDEENYLVKYLISKGVQPSTWYTRVRLTKIENGVYQQYYDNPNNRPGTMEQGKDYSTEANAEEFQFSAPPCDTQSLSGIKALTFDKNYVGWSMNFEPQQ